MCTWSHLIAQEYQRSARNRVYASFTSGNDENKPGSQKQIPGTVGRFVAALAVLAGTLLFPAIMMGGDSSKQASDSVQWPPEGNKLPVATFAGGCFWGVELAFQREAGVEYSCVGYAQGEVPNPSYEAVCTGSTGHTEAVQVVYNPEQVSFERLCRLLFERINHRQKNGQGNDRGSQYRAGIYCHSNEQLEVAQRVNKDFEGSVVEVLPISSFYPAEAYHQQYLEKGGRWGRRQCASKGCQDAIRCYG